jgi:nucleotidyltransferase/DNA polymerase involved in DNA repair
MRLLRRFVNAAVVEKASIDEAFILCQSLPGLGQSGAGGGAGQSGGGGEAGGAAAGKEAAWDLSAGVRLGSAIRDASRSELGLVLSVGVATNKLLAKLVRGSRRFEGVELGRLCGRSLVL